MTRLFIILILLVNNLCFSQDEYELSKKAELELMNSNFQLAVDLFNQVIEIGDDFNLTNYYYSRAEAKYYLRDYEGALADINESLIRRDNSCYTRYLRGLIKLKLSDRNGACIDWQQANELCNNNFKRKVETHCDESWDYDKGYKVHYEDTTYIGYYTKAHYVGCEAKVSDTTYTVNYELIERGNDWEIFYDSELKNKLAHYYTRNDTLYKIYYYNNGLRKSEERTVNHDWVYSATWCDNGQLESAGNPNSLEYRTQTAYYCNGNKSWQGNLWQGRVWGLETRWYENGQKKSEKKYTEYNKELADNGELENKFLSSKFWDEKGNEVQAFQDQIININSVGAPIYISSKELNGTTAYYNIKDQKEYDKKMQLFSEVVYNATNLQVECKCKYGVVYISFVVSKDGTIKDITLNTSLEDCVDTAFINAIKKIGYWTPGKTNDQNVDVYVKIGLELERIKK